MSARRSLAEVGSNPKLAQRSGSATGSASSVSVVTVLTAKTVALWA